jgi:hypothetical protein
MEDILDIIVDKHHKCIKETGYSPKYLILSPSCKEKVSAQLSKIGQTTYNCLSGEDTFRGMTIVIKRTDDDFVDVVGKSK